MKLKFSANISTMFKEFPLIERFQKAREAGFEAIEIQDPYVLPPDKIRQQMSGLKCDLVNIICESPFGCAAIPVRQEEFISATNQVLPYYDVLQFKKLHILSGEKSPRFEREDHYTQLVESLRSLEDYLENMNVIGLIEPISPTVNENYFLNSFEEAVNVLKDVGNNQIRLLLDVYHLHNITNNVEEFLPRYYPYAGHIQVSQDPGRVEPFAPGGQIDYNFVFDFLKRQKHNDFIGLEYSPSSGSTADSLTWMQKFL